MSKVSEKSCPKCGGRLFIDVDESEVFDHCLMCGYTRCISKETCPVCGAVMDYNEGAYRCLNCNAVEVL